MRLYQLVRHQDDERYRKQRALHAVEQHEREIRGDAEAQREIFHQPRAHFTGMSILGRGLGVR